MTQSRFFFARMKLGFALGPAGRWVWLTWAESRRFEAGVSRGSLGRNGLLQPESASQFIPNLANNCRCGTCSCSLTRGFLKG